MSKVSKKIRLLNLGIYGFYSYQYQDFNLILGDKIVYWGERININWIRSGLDYVTLSPYHPDNIEEVLNEHDYMVVDDSTVCEEIRERYMNF